MAKHNDPPLNQQKFYDAQEDLNVKDTFLQDKIVYNYDDFKSVAVLKAEDFVRDTRPWVYNRSLNDENVADLKAKYLLYDKVYSPLWNISIIYDELSKDIVKLYILDGQHRREVLRQLLQEGKVDKKMDIVCTIYNIKDCQGSNKNISTELFKKINNNLPLNLKDIPDTFVQDVVDRIILDPVLNPAKYIKLIENVNPDRKNKDKFTAREPKIHKRELYEKFKDLLVYYKDLSIDDVIANLRIIVNKIRFEDCENIYDCTNHEKNDIQYERYGKAKNYDFWLGLKSSAKYNPEMIIKSIADPSKFDK